MITNRDKERATQYLIFLAEEYKQYTAMSRIYWIISLVSFLIFWVGLMVDSPYQICFAFAIFVVCMGLHIIYEFKKVKNLGYGNALRLFITEDVSKILGDENE